MTAPLRSLVSVLARLARVALVCAAVAAGAWLLAEAAPGTAGERAARAAGLLPADDGQSPPELRRRIADRVAAEHRLDRALPIRIGAHVGGLARLDLGRSWRDGEPVAGRVGRSAARTLILAALALAVACGFGLAFALLAARGPGRPLDLALSAAAAIAIALPPAWVAMLALRTFAAGSPWRLLPSGGLDSPAAVVLPVVALALVPAFVCARHGRSALLAAAAAPWAIAARARGASRDRVLVVHALRASAAELLPLLPALTAYLLGASLVVERVFGIRGLGQLVADAAAGGDAPVVVGACVAAAAVIATSSEIADALARQADPRLAAGRGTAGSAG